MAKKIKNAEPTVTPITINTLNISRSCDLLYEIGLGKLIKLVVDKQISEDELNAVFDQITRIAFGRGMVYALDNVPTVFCFKAVKKNPIKRAWNKIKSWFKK